MRWLLFVSLLLVACAPLPVTPTPSETSTIPPIIPSDTPNPSPTETVPPTATLSPTPFFTRTPRPTSSPRPAPTHTSAPLPPAPSATSENCHPSYPSVCLEIGIGDYDCAGGSGNGPNYVKGPIIVLPPDPFDLDRDGDGIGCESG